MGFDSDAVFSVQLAPKSLCLSGHASSSHSQLCRKQALWNPSMELVDNLPEEVQSVADHIRMWAPCILQASETEGADDAAGAEMMLSRAVHKLDAVSHSLSGKALLDDVGPKHSAIQLVEILAVSQVLANQEELANVVRKCVALAVPPAFQSASFAKLQRHGKSVPSRRSVHRAQFTFDVAWALHSRRFYSQSEECPVAFFFWADSSPQGGRDWMLCHCHAVRPRSAQQMREALAALQGLCSQQHPHTMRLSQSLACMVPDDEGFEAAPLPELETLPVDAARREWTQKVTRIMIHGERQKKHK